jgi:capsule biosynthesis phosphatase
MKTYVIDLDHTVCIPGKFDDSHRRYRLAEPIGEMIEWIQLEHHRGNRIIFHTARRMLTHRGDLKKIEEDVGQITRDWLAEHNVPYDELIFGKPYGDAYIDDKALRPQELFPSDFPEY